MTVQLIAGFSQAKAGAPLKARQTAIFPTHDDWSGEDAVGFGVKTANTAPTAVSDFAAHIDDSGSAMDYQDNRTEFVNQPQNTARMFTVRFTNRKQITLDSNWVAGHYAFAYVAASDGSLTAVSSAYHIR